MGFHIRGFFYQLTCISTTCWLVNLVSAAGYWLASDIRSPGRRFDRVFLPTDRISVFTGHVHWRISTNWPTFSSHLLLTAKICPKVLDLYASIYSSLLTCRIMQKQLIFHKIWRKGGTKAREEPTKLWGRSNLNLDYTRLKNKCLQWFFLPFELHGHEFDFWWADWMKADYLAVAGVCAPLSAILVCTRITKWYTSHNCSQLYRYGIVDFSIPLDTV